MPGVRLLAPLEVADEVGAQVTRHQERNQEHAEYIQWIHTQPCAACGYRGPAIQAAHVGRGGMGMKHGSDAEVIPLCGPRLVIEAFFPITYGGCHAAHDQLKEHFRIGLNGSSRTAIREWATAQVVGHRKRFEARNVDAQGKCPF